MLFLGKLNKRVRFVRVEDYIASDLLDKYEFHNYNHALEILTQSFPDEWSEIVECMRKLMITIDDLREAGGNETSIPKKFEEVLNPYGWKELRISGDLHIKMFQRQMAQRRGRFSSTPFDEKVVQGYIDGHNIDLTQGETGAVLF